MVDNNLIENKIDFNILVNNDPISIQVKGVQSVIDAISENNISAYIDLTNYTVGTYEVEVKLENNDSRVKFVVSNKVSVVISAS